MGVVIIEMSETLVELHVYLARTPGVFLRPIFQKTSLGIAGRLSRPMLLLNSFARVFLALLYPYAQFYLADVYTVVYQLASPPVIVKKL